MFDKQLLEIKGAKGALAICGALSLLRAFTVLGQAVFLSRAVCGLWAGLNIYSAIIDLSLFAAFFVAREIIKCCQEAYIDRFAIKAVLDIQRSYMESMFDAGPSPLLDQGIPASVALIVDGSSDIEQHIRVSFPKLTDCVIVPAVIVAALFVLDAISGFIALICLPFIFIFMRLIGMSARDEANKRHAQFEKLSNSFVDKAQGIADLKAFGTDRRFAKVVYDTSEAFRRITMKTLRVAMLSSAVLDLFATLALAAVAIMLGFRMVDGDVAFFPALCVLVLVPEYFKPVREFGSNYHDTLEGKESLRALVERIGANIEARSGETAFWADSLGDARKLDIDTTAPLSHAVIGPSGSGKTTLLNAIAGLVNPPRDFSIVIDGERIEALQSDTWRKRVAYIPQDPHIFNDTIRENVRFYNPGATDSDVERALEEVGLSDLLSGLADGLDTKIGEGGRELSGGQMARVALSRAFVDDKRDIILMDEPSAHLDAETERDIRKATERLIQGKVAFIVTHNEEWADEMDDRIQVANR